MSKATTTTVLDELFASQRKATPTALQLLRRLLASGVINEDQVRQAHAELTATTTKKEAATPTTVSSRHETITATAINDTVVTAPNTSASTSPPNVVASTAMRTRPIALHVAYNGANYSGLAEHVGLPTDSSVEKHLFAALRKASLVPVSRDACHYTRCGRTDKGVSAHGQVVALHLKSAFAPNASYDCDGEQLVPEEDLPRNALQGLSIYVVPRNKGGAKQSKKQQPQPDTEQDDNDAMQRVYKPDYREYAYDQILNKLLPPDITIVGWTPVSSEFSARFSATTRTYRYYFLTRHLSWERMQEALPLWVGNHDFRNFCKMNVEQISNYHRHIYEASLHHVDDQVAYLCVCGQAFLWHQIRNMVAILFLIGKGLEEPSIISELLDVSKNPGKPHYNMAPERPLVLHHCAYPQLQFGYNVVNLWAVTTKLETQWEECILQAARLRGLLDVIGEQLVSGSDVKSFVQGKLEERQQKRKQNGGSAPASIIGNSSNKNDERVGSSDSNGDNPYTEDMLNSFDSTPLCVWSKVLRDLHEQFDLRPDMNMGLDWSHRPLCQRSRGTTYEEKVASILHGSSSARRKEKFTTNIIRKRKSPEEDSAFYQHKIQQGGSGI
jgi:tRNA pseudouridine38/39 synthase